MKNIRDLHFNQEILPLFDFTGNEHSRAALIRLLSELPGTIAGVLSRQEIIRCLMKISGPVPYSKSDFQEAYHTVEDLRNRDRPLPGKLDYFIFKAKKDRESGRLNQLFIFFYKIQQAYFLGLPLEGVPPDFGERVKGLGDFLTGLQVEKYGAIARRRGFNIPETIKGMERLAEKISRGEMAVFWEDFFLFEAYLSVSRGIAQHGFVFPVFRETGLVLTDFYHPLLKGPVKNSLTVQETVILITGPNMSGKSTLLKAIGLCVYLGHLGLAVPAAACEMSFYSVISVAINLNDDLQSGYSHFMSEIKVLKNVVVEAGSPRAVFAIFDELFRGTNVEDALAISKTTIWGLTKFTGSCFFISTHLHQLREALMFPEKDYKIGMHYIECALGEGKPVFTYRLKEGWSDLKIGQIIFEQEGLNELLRPVGIG